MLAAGSTTAPGSSLVVTAAAAWAAGTIRNGYLSDGTYAFRKATVKASNTVPSSGDQALVVSISPNSATHTVTLSSNATVIPSSVNTVTLSSNPTTILSSNPTVILSSNPTVTAVSSGLMLTKGSYGPAQLTQASINVASSGNNTLVTRAVGTIKVYGLFAVPDGGMTIQFCNGSTAAVLSGPMSINSITLPVQTEPYFTTTGTNNFVVNLSTSVQLSGMIYYLDN